MKRGAKVYTYIEYSFVTPLWAFERWPDSRLPERTTKTFPKERAFDGEAWLTESLKAVHAGTWIPEKLRKEKAARDSITFREYATRWVENRKKPDGTDLKETARQKYRESLELYLLPFFGDMPMTAITPRDVQRWYDEFRPVRLDADIENRRAHVYRHLATLMKSAAEEPLDNGGRTLIPVSPCRLRVGKPDVKHVPVRPTREQLDALLTVLPDWVRLVVLLCDGAGLRESEALGLRRRHIDLKGLKIHVCEQVQRVKSQKTDGYETVITTPKTKSSIATVAMSPQLAGSIAEWIEQEKITAPDAHLFVSARTGEVRYGQLYRNEFAKARKKVAGLETMRPHDLRKDCLSLMLENKATVAEVMRQGRHTTMAVASRYQVTDEQHLSEVMARMDERGARKPASARNAVPASVSPEGATPGEPSPASGERAAAGADDSELKALADMLAGMDAADRVAVLRPLPVERRVKALELLPVPVRVETMTELLKGVE
ncbi:site-specific integrase [Bifidobacterium jacchi]|uniref:site-specific integrase n=1 Tax=Bifidobacterium jacchi TaxID=2490545 RepID=UPI0015881B66|nr:site-specific integrase [Bifidobacterium jacchi]